MASNFKSPNFDDRNSPIEMIVLHYTGMKSGIEAIERLCDPASKVSAHYVLEEDGTLHNLVPEEKRAWHAGISYWRGSESVNACSIGIEIVNPGHEFGYRPFTEDQYTKLIDLLKLIKKTYQIKDINIVGHSDVAPDRKEDPGELFDWKRLADNGIGLWPSQQAESSKQKADLRTLGYKAHDEKSITAFQRHWRQNKVNGIWDDECQQILSSLI